MNRKSSGIQESKGRGNEWRDNIRNANLVTDRGTCECTTSRCSEPVAKRDEDVSPG